ncbi:hypothetical protein C8F04DRAFT_1113657, partial [Mycena alexandri]
MAPGGGRYGYLDFFAAGSPEVRPRRAAAMELKYFSLDGFILADCQDPDKPGLDYEVLRLKSQTLEAKAQLLNSLSDAELGAQFYCYYDHKTKQVERVTVDSIITQAIQQLGSYTTAIRNGSAKDFKTHNNHQQRNGIPPWEHRVDATGSGNDTVIGYVGAGFGARVRITAVETFQSKSRFRGRKNWQSRYIPNYKGM